MPTRLLEGRILHVSGGGSAAAYNTFEAMPVGAINAGGTLSGEEDFGDCRFGTARFLAR
jgi:hypothetical protein